MWFLASASLLLASIRSVTSLTLDTTSPQSIKTAAAAVAHQLLNGYVNDNAAQESLIGTFVNDAVDGQMYYWWEWGAMWGGLIDYWAYTGDDTYNEFVTNALYAQSNHPTSSTSSGAPGYDFMPAAYLPYMGNDDIAFWIFAVLTAAEYGFPSLPSPQPSWLQIAETAFDSMASRRMGPNEPCKGGLRWQLVESKTGYNYVNSITNGAFFQIAARLAAQTGNQTYIDIANEAWDWSTNALKPATISGAPTYDYGLVKQANGPWSVHDGLTMNGDQCTPSVAMFQWNYAHATYMYGAAIMYNYTVTDTWRDRASSMVNSALTLYSTSSSSSIASAAWTANVLCEPMCEWTNTCNHDQLSFKAYLARFLGKATVVLNTNMPSIVQNVQSLLGNSASVAAKTCDDAGVCGAGWLYTDATRNTTSGRGQALSALEVLQSLLVDAAPALKRVGGAAS